MFDRDQHILKAVEWLVNERGCSHFHACVMLAKELKHFKTVILPRIHAGGRTCNTELEKILLTLFNADNPPLSVAHLHKIVSKLLKRRLFSTVK
jgi:hypothetical protein